uniref:Uncharacterized protein n=1 Tax=Rhizophora mucronata TaxID=61149 RepID=A0A2P2NBH6_RHIMU
MNKLEIHMPFIIKYKGSMN